MGDPPEAGVGLIRQARVKQLAAMALWFSARYNWAVVGGSTNEKRNLAHVAIFGSGRV